MREVGMFDLIVFHINTYIVVRSQISSVSNCILHSSFYYISQDSAINPPFIKTPLEIYSHHSTNPLPTPACLVWFSTLSLLYLSLPSPHNRNILFFSLSFRGTKSLIKVSNLWSSGARFLLSLQTVDFLLCIHLGGRGRLGGRKAGSKKKVE